MPGIFLCGPSGTGKTTFCKTMSANYGFGHIIDVIKTMNKSKPGIKDLDFYQRQIVYYTELFKIHHINKRNFLTDRSVLDVLAWTDVDPEFVDYIGLAIKAPDLILVVPTPPFSWYKDREKAMVRTRFPYYKDKLGLEDKEYAKDKALNIMYDTERRHHALIMKMISNLDWTYHVLEPSLRADEFMPTWQTQAEKKVFEVWNVPRFTLDSFSDISNEEREEIRQHLIEKREAKKLENEEATEETAEEEDGSLNGGSIV